MVAKPDNPHRLCNCPGAGTDFGIIPDSVSRALAIAAGPIRLQLGIPGPDGFGKLHIEGAPGRLNKIRSLGYDTIEHFVENVAGNYDRICDAGSPAKISIVHKRLEHDLCLILRFSPHGFWSVTTGLPYRVYRRPVRWQATQPGGSESPPRVAEPSRFETLSLPKGRKPIGGSGS